jgi:hypothetical protein
VLYLLELYIGRHAFEGRVPEPGQAPIVADDDIQPASLAAFFRKALDPTPEKRFPSERAMCEALLVALFEDTITSSSVPSPKQINATTPLRTSGLSTRVINALACRQVRIEGRILALPATQVVRAIHAIDTNNHQPRFNEGPAIWHLGGATLALRHPLPS